MMQCKYINAPVGGVFQAKVAGTASGDCTLRIHAQKMRLNGFLSAANDIQHARAA